MVLSKDKSVLQNFTEVARLEWLETNGLGGWAGSSLCGCHTRRYHGLLMASIHPPAERVLLVSKLDETIVVDGKTFELATNDYGDALAPQGFKSIESFQRNLFPEWIFNVPGIRLRKTIGMVTGENTTMIRYEVLSATSPFTMQLLPLIAARGYHELQHAYNNIYWKAEFNGGVFHNRPFEDAPDIYISVPGSDFRPIDKWYYHFNYQEEKYRGLDYEEDLFNHGVFTVNLKQGDSLNIMISTADPSGRDMNVLFETEKKRKLSLLNGSEGDLLKQLILAADQFIVRRDLQTQSVSSVNQSLKTVIAGYHWFTDWARDTMISLPGLCLSTGRFEDAKKIISVFAQSVSMGMLPNRFMDNKEPPEYNNADGTLWYFHAVYSYWQASGDRLFVLAEILPVLKVIMDWHFKGTRFNIHEEPDGLLYAGETGQQLTWMDARVGNQVITARMGKPVEIQALWYNALMVFAYLLAENGENDKASVIRTKADHTRKSFGETFWYEAGNYYYDVIDENGKPDTSIRPNQIFAVSLPFSLSEGTRAKKVWELLRRKLYTIVGLRSLSPEDPSYKGHYGGDVFLRDSAYHQGTVWSWLLGAFIEAGMKTMGEAFRAEAQDMIDQFAGHINEACIGTVSEIFDGDSPHEPRGCVAQAWGVAEILRVIKTYSFIHS